MYKRKSKAAGGKNLMGVQVFIEHFKKSLNKPLFLLENPAPSAVLIF
jgi:hypothetical protein